MSLRTRNYFFTVMVTEHQHTLPRDDIESQFSVIYKNHLGIVLLYMALLEQGAQPGDLQRLLPNSTII